MFRVSAQTGTFVQLHSFRQLFHPFGGFIAGGGGDPLTRFCDAFVYVSCMPNFYISHNGNFLKEFIGETMSKLNVAGTDPQCSRAGVLGKDGVGDPGVRGQPPRTI